MWGKKAIPIGRAPAIVLTRPKYPHNVGAAVRAASCFGIEQVWFTGDRVSLDPESGQRQLLDLSVDPGEKRDLAPERVGLAEELAEVITRRFSTPATAPREAVELDPQTLEELRALGYLK